VYDINDFLSICTTSQEIYIELIFLYFFLKRVTYKNTSNTASASSCNEKPKLDLSRYTKWFSLSTDKPWMRLLTLLLDMWIVLKFLYRLFTKHTICHFQNTLLKEGLRNVRKRFSCKCNTVTHPVGGLSSCFVISFWTDNLLILQADTRRN